MTGVQTCALDRKSTRLNSSHTIISYAVFCLKKNTALVGVAAGLMCAPFFPGLGVGVRGAGCVGCLEVGQRLVREHAGCYLLLFFFNDTAPPEIYPLSLPDPFPI